MKRVRNMTQLSQEMFAKATHDHMELRDVISLLRSEANIRRVRDTLAYFSHIPADRPDELQAYITAKLAACVPGAKPDSVRRKVQLWMKDDALTISKQSAIQLAFALELDLNDANAMLKRLCEEGLHWRDPEEVVFIFALLHGMSYADALALRKAADAEIASGSAADPESAVYTEQVKSRVSNITSDGELIDFLRESRKDLGEMHNTAYHLFMDFLDLLGMPVMDYASVFKKDTEKEYAEKALVDIKKFASREIMDTYLYRRFIPVAQRKSKTEPDKLVFSALQRNVRQNWPDEVTLSKMIHRETDVTRKVLILLFLATDGGDSAYADEYLDEREPEEVFSDVYERLNMMLTDCGFAELDPRVQFDWMILYCMCVNDSIYIDGKIQRFLAEIFPSTGAVPDAADSDMD